MADEDVNLFGMTDEEFDAYIASVYVIREFLDRWDDDKEEE